MSLDVYLMKMERVSIFERNITHNLGKMAGEAGIYEALWRPEEIGITKAEELIPLLEAGLEKLLADPDRFTALNPENGWGTYEGLCKFVESYLSACKKSPDAEIEVSR